MLRFTDVDLKLISAIEKYQIVESTIKGCVSMIFKGYAKANNKFLIQIYIIYHILRR